MHHSHWLLLFPYYFFAALSVLLLLSLFCRLTGFHATLRALSGIAVASGIVAVGLPLTVDLADLSDYTVGRMLLLGGASLLLAGLDAAVARARPHSVDGELAQL